MTQQNSRGIDVSKEEEQYLRSAFRRFAVPYLFVCAVMAWATTTVMAKDAPAGSGEEMSSLREKVAAVEQSGRAAEGGSGQSVGGGRERGRGEGRHGARAGGKPGGCAREAQAEPGGRSAQRHGRARASAPRGQPTARGTGARHTFGGHG